MVVYITQSAFARRWGISRQYVGKLVRRGRLTLCYNRKLDLVFADLFMVKSGTGLLCIPANPTNREQYLNRREIRLSIIRQYESQHETELTQEEIDMIDNDPPVMPGEFHLKVFLPGYEFQPVNHFFPSAVCV